MLNVQQITKSFGIDLILDKVSFTLNVGERLGLVGPNGCGKTTLLRIITGQEQPDSGVILIHPPGGRLGYLPQGYEFPGEETIESFITRMEGNLPVLEVRLQELAEALGKTPNLPGLLEDYDETLVRLNAATMIAGRGPEVLASLGLGQFALDTAVRTLSGGQKTRLALAGVLLSAPELLLLDEPTNHLDIGMLEWLEEWLMAYRGAVLLVSHDRAMLDRVATGILEIDPHTHSAQVYEGNYSAYLEQKQAEIDHQWNAYNDQQEEISRLRRSATAVRSRARFHKGGKADPANTDGFSAGFFSDRSKETVQKAKNIEKRIERLLTEERIDKPQRSWQMKVEFGDTPESGRDVLVLEDLSVGYNENALLEKLNLTLRNGRRVALIGPNGSGKTTLVRTMIGQIPALAGRVRLGSRVKIGYMAQEQENLDPTSTPLDTLKSLLSQNETEVRAFLSKFLFKGDDVFAPVNKLSYGERARLSLAVLAAQGCNLLMLDEPINHLDIPSRARFEEALGSFEGTVLAVVHDRYFIESFATEIWEITGKSVRVENRE